VSESVPPDPTRSKDQAALAKECEEDRPTVDLGDVVALIPAVAAVGAALAYGVLILSYSEFYAELGVRPGDVGLEYGPGLGGIAGVAVLLILGLAVLWLYVEISRWMTRRSDSGARKRRRPFLIGAVIVGGLTVAVIAFFLIDDAREAAAKARNGTPVGPLTLKGVEVVALRADRAEVIPADPQAANSETYRQLKNREPLMYLGRSGSGLVLYDPDRERSWQIPASMFTVRTLNCEENVDQNQRDSDCPDD
jgi:hypothetical protein